MTKEDYAIPGRVQVLFKYSLNPFLVLERNDGDVGFVLSLLGELDGTVDKGIQGVVLTHTDIGIRVVDGTTLTDDDVTGLHDLTAELLKTESFGMRLTTVLGTGLTFFMCHNLNLLQS